jgi:RNA polymerase sigma factor (sigma-70 family)
MGIQDPQTVDDAVVLGFEKLQEKGLVECSSLIGYARSFAYRAGQRVARQLLSEWKNVTDEPDEHVVDDDPLIEDLVITAEEEAKRQEQLERELKAAMECLETLTPGQREAVVEVEMKGKSDSQLAQETGVSHTAVWKRRNKAIAILRDCVEHKLANREGVAGKEDEGDE